MLGLSMVSLILLCVLVRCASASINKQIERAKAELMLNADSDKYFVTKPNQYRYLGISEPNDSKLSRGLRLPPRSFSFEEANNANV